MWPYRWSRPPGGIPILMRTGKRRSAAVIISCALPGISDGSLSVLRRKCHRRFAVSSPLGPDRRAAYLLRMCGRVRLSSDVSEIKLVFSIPPHRPTPNFPPSWNVAPPIRSLSSAMM
jgi:hypothetical protein